MLELVAIASRPGEMLRCPWHGWEFGIRNGKSQCDLQKIRAQTYDVRVAAGGKLDKKLLIADTFHLHVEGSYVVIDA